MNAHLTAEIDNYRYAIQFLEALDLPTHAPDLAPAYGPQLEELRSAIEQIDRHIVNRQTIPGGSGERRAQMLAIRAAIRQEVAPLVLLARVFAERTHPGMPELFRMPYGRWSNTQFAVHTTMLSKMTAEHRALLTENGLPADLPERLATLARELERLAGLNRMVHGNQAGARAGIATARTQARLALTHLTVIVTPYLRHDRELSSMWRALAPAARTIGIRPKEGTLPQLPPGATPPSRRISGGNVTQALTERSRAIAAGVRRLLAGQPVKRLTAGMPDGEEM